MKDVADNTNKNLDWIQHIMIRKLTIRRESFYNPQEHWDLFFFLMNSKFLNLDHLALYNLKIQEDIQLAKLLFAISSLKSLRELSLSLDLEDNSSMSLNRGAAERNYNFSNLKTFNLTYNHRTGKCFNFQRPNENSNRSYLKSFRQMSCPKLKYLRVHLYTQYLDPQTKYLLWYLELLQKFASTLKYLKISVVYWPSSLTEDKYFDTVTINEKALRIGSEFRNLKELDVDFFGGLITINDERSGPIKGWMNLFYGMRASLENLKILLCQGSQALCNQYELLTKNSFPHLKVLNLVWNHFQLDWKMMTQISDHLETLKLQSRGGGFNKKVKNFDQIPLSLKKIALWDFASSVEDWDFLIKLISLRKSLTVEYNFLINFQMAEYLGDCLTWPNFIWKGIKYNNQEELSVTSLCLAFDISWKKLYRLEPCS